ncbi:MAG: hypothetical protein Crog4KO_05750 [Crocinitomicaceae bacterium]
MATLKTPGVYVQEISKFPPSVAPVATAIPAFIGYTEKATELLAGDLNLVPKRINSMLDYEQYFGFAQDEENISVQVTKDGKIAVSNDTPSSYKMYYSMQMYFANGGGPCYVTSIGVYGDDVVTPDAIVLNDYNEGLAAIRKEDEPTLLLFPDSQSLSSADFYALNQSSLTQCAELQDRFSIMDTYGDNSTAIDNFRTGIGVDNLRYGAAYYPFLDTILDYQYSNDNVSVFEDSTEKVEDRIESIQSGISTSSLVSYLNALDTLRTDFATMLAADVVKCIPDVRNEILNTKSYFENLKMELELAATLGDESADTEATDLIAWVTANIDPILSDIETTLADVSSQTTKSGLIGDIENYFTNVLGFAVLGTFTDGIVLGINTMVSTGELDALQAAVLAAAPSETVAEYTLEELETLNNDLYNRIKAAISDFPVTLPPSSAMAGIYARVDNAVGVWKAPANVTVQYVQQPTVRISNEDQEDMNVTSSGKSVNAIRTFTGKGTLAWGARTLAGNDNEWRYISVRRFFNFVEESVSEATEQFVFEPNTANTWVRVRGLIESFLLQQWKAGALAGAKPEDAYYVRIGLGQTMTSQDVLEGRMIVEIGMAAVRPAEFIVLKFSHKMQEA